jgi:hypothetical protein
VAHTAAAIAAGKRPRRGRLEVVIGAAECTSRVAAASTRRLRNSGRAPLRLPRRNQTDLAVSKTFCAMGERLRPRSGFMNAFNHTHWMTANADLRRHDGRDADLRAVPARIPFSLKLYW